MRKVPRVPLKVSFDANILIWAFRTTHYKFRGQEPTDEQKELQKKCGYLFSDLQRQGAKVVLSSIVVSEYLAGIDPANHGNVLTEITSRFDVYSFDVRAAALAATLWNSRPKPTDIVPGRRVAMKADTMIVATLKLRGVSAFYSYDENCQKTAKLAGLIPKGLPTHDEYLFPDDPATT